MGFGLGIVSFGGQKLEGLRDLLRGRGGHAPDEDEADDGPSGSRHGDQRRTQGVSSGLSQEDKTAVGLTVSDGCCEGQTPACDPCGRAGRKCEHPCRAYGLDSRRERARRRRAHGVKKCRCKLIR